MFMSSLPKSLLLLLVTDMTRCDYFLGYIFWPFVKIGIGCFGMLSPQKLSVFVGLHNHTSSYDCCASKFDVESEPKTASK